MLKPMRAMTSYLSYCLLLGLFLKIIYGCAPINCIEDIHQCYSGKKLEQYGNVAISMEQLHMAVAFMLIASLLPAIALIAITFL